MAAVAATDCKLCGVIWSVIEDTVPCFSVETDSVIPNSVVASVGVIAVVSCSTLLDSSVRGKLDITVMECTVVASAVCGGVMVDTDGADSDSCVDGVVCAVG